MASLKTYILAPNFTYHPDTSICMGDIIQNPDDPTKPLSSPAPATPPTESHLDFDASLYKHNTLFLQGSIWAKFLKSATSALGGGVRGDVLDKYAIDRLETVYFRKQPTDEEATERVKDEKIARGFRLESGDVSEAAATAGAGAYVNSEVSVGASMSARGKEDVQVFYRSGQDIIFAYQLHIITYKGWLGEKHLDISVYKPKAAFLSDENGPVEQELATTRDVTAEDIIDFDDRVEIEEVAAADGDERCVCIVFKEDD